MNPVKIIQRDFSVFPVVHLKIDKVFVDNVVEDSTIASAIINLGKSLNLQVIAEGIEAQKQNEKLLELGCNLAQGYLFGKPVEAVEFLNDILFTTDQKIKIAKN